MTRKTIPSIPGPVIIFIINRRLVSPGRLGNRKEIFHHHIVDMDGVMPYF